ncbi:MAG: AraC family transcriptional regulator [Pseudomonadota bacterium]
MENDKNGISVVAPGPLANRKLGLHAVQPGMRLMTVNVDVQEHVGLDIEPVNTGIFVSLVLDGRSEYTVQSPAGSHDQWELVPGWSVVGTFHAEKSRWDVFPGEPHRIVELQIASPKVRQLVSDYRKTGPGSVHPIFDRPKGFPRHIEQPLTPELRMIAHQVLNCPLEGPARRLFMESKTLEILAFQWHALSSPTLPQPMRRSKGETERLEEARRILEKEFADPPSLLTLARRVGLNDFKLKRGFREVYQTTVFGYVRMLRMEKARILLETGELNVGEVAAVTGYSCFGHFSEAFRKRFGISPKDLKKGRRF